MTKLLWGEPGTRFYESGCDQGVLYPSAGPGVAWPGLISVQEDVDGGELSSFYYDGQKYADVVAGENFRGSIETFAEPAEFAVCDGLRQLASGLFAAQQPRESFGLSYRTMIGNDVDDEYGYKIHLVWDALAAPTSRSRRTRSDSTEPEILQWNISTVPPSASTYRPTAHFVIDSRGLSLPVLTSLENELYGTVSTAPRLPTQAEIIDLLT